MKTFFFTLLGVLIGLVIAITTAYAFLHWYTLTRLIKRLKQYRVSPRLAWSIELMVQAGMTTVEHRKMICKMLERNITPNMEAIKLAMGNLGITNDITQTPSFISRNVAEQDLYAKQRTTHITINDTQKCFGIGFLIIMTYFFIKDLEINKFNNSPLYIIFCSAEIFQNGECSDRSIGTNFNFNKDTDLNSFFTHFHKGVCELYQYTDDLSSIETFVTRVYPYPQN